MAAVRFRRRAADVWSLRACRRPHQDGALNAVGAELAELLVQGLALAVGGSLHHVEVSSRTARETGTFFQHVVRVRPIKALEAHLLQELGDDPPVGLGLTRCIVEIRIEANTTLAIGAGEGVLAPARRRKDDFPLFGSNLCLPDRNQTSKARRRRSNEKRQFQLSLLNPPASAGGRSVPAIGTRPPVPDHDGRSL